MTGQHRFSMAMAIFLLSAAACWADAVVKDAVKADTAEKFVSTVSEINTEMDAGGRYEFISATDKIKVQDDLNRMSAMLQASHSVGQMTADQKIALFNLQENLNGILTKSDSNRLVCEHQAPLGSHIKAATCQTVGQIERRRRESQKYMTDHDLDANVHSAQFHAASPSKGG